MKPKKKIKAHSLTGRITDELLLKAHKAVKKNRGTCGIDRVSLDMYGAKLEQNLENLKIKLKTRDFQPKPLRRKWIKKEPGKNAAMRPLGIPTVEDRIAQEVVRQLINPIFERKFHDNSYGFRPGRSCHHAMAKVIEYQSQGYTWVVDADIKGFFDNIPHSLIMAAMCEEIADGNVLGLIEKFLQAGVMEDGKLFPSTRGTPQGGVVSPLLANAVLNHLDWRLEGEGYKFVRYADDFVVMCKTRPLAERALDFVRIVIEEELGLELHPEKTQIHRFRDGFEFLGFLLSSSGVTMRQKSKEKFKDKIRALTIRSRNLDSKVIDKLNSVVRGTVNYFATPRTHRKPMIKLAQWVRKRLRCMKKKRISDFDNIKVTNKMLSRKGYQDLLDTFDLAKQRSQCSQPWATV